MERPVDFRTLVLLPGLFGYVWMSRVEWLVF